MTAAKLKIPPRAISLVATPKDTDLTGILFVILEAILATKGSAALILSSRPIKQFAAKAKQSGFDMNEHLNKRQLAIIDCMSRYVGDRGEDLPNIFYASSPSDLSELTLISSEATSSISAKGDKWMILDSVSTFLLYNTTGGLLRFLHYILSKLRILDFGGAIIVVRDELSDPMVQSLKQYCDKIIDLEPEEARPRRQKP